MPFFVIAIDRSDTILLTDFAKNVAAYRTTKSLDLEDILQCLGKISASRPYNNYIIAPSSEALNIFLLDNRVRLESNGYTIPLVDADLYKKLSGKRAFVDMCQQCAIDIPDELPYESITPVVLPIVAKPILDIDEDHKRLSPEILKTEQQLSRFRATANAEQYFYQRYISGDSYYFLFYVHRDGHIDMLSQRNLLQQPNGKSIVLAETASLHETSHVNPYVRMLKDLQFRGLIMIEVRKTPDRVFMIEANPRMWGPAQLMPDSGCNLFTCFINDYANTYFSFGSTLTTAGYLWSGGILQTLASGKTLDAHASPDRIAARLISKNTVDILDRSDTRQAYRNELVTACTRQHRGTP